MWWEEERKRAIREAGKVAMSVTSSSGSSVESSGGGLGSTLVVLLEQIQNFRFDHTISRAGIGDQRKGQVVQRRSGEVASRRLPWTGCVP